MVMVMAVVMVYLVLDMPRRALPPSGPGWDDGIVLHSLTTSLYFGHIEMFTLAPVYPCFPSRISNYPITVFPISCAEGVAACRVYMPPLTHFPRGTNTAIPPRAFSKDSSPTHGATTHRQPPRKAAPRRDTKQCIEVIRPSICLLSVCVSTVFRQ